MDGDSPNQVEIAQRVSIALRVRTQATRSSTAAHPDTSAAPVVKRKRLVRPVPTKTSSTRRRVKNVLKVIFVMV